MTMSVASLSRQPSVSAPQSAMLSCYTIGSRLVYLLLLHISARRFPEYWLKRRIGKDFFIISI